MSEPPFTLTQELHVAFRRIRLRKEQALFTYLPDANSMRRGGYEGELVGLYEHTRFEQPVYRLTMLSQTEMLLLFRDEKYVAARVVKTDEELFRFLVVHDFPLPQ